jgi:3-methyl-2-oxobutanoate hydroxymethyltransferase
LLAAGADGVKLEGGVDQAPIVAALVADGIAVCGHIGFTPQTLGTKGRIQGKTLEQGQVIVRAAQAMERAGAFLLVMELVTEPISRLITEQLTIPTIGIGSGRYCDGQVLVVTDLLGLSTFERKLNKRYENLHERVGTAMSQYVQEVRERQFPTEANAFQNISEEEVTQLRAWVQRGMPDE